MINIITQFKIELFLNQEKNQVELQDADKKMLRCYYCKKEFQIQQSLCQHIHAKHQSKVILCDEHVSSKVYQYRFHGYELIDTPEHLRGYEDHELVNYAKQKGFGLATKDKKCAEYASNYLSPVFYIDMETDEISRFN